MVLFNNIPYKRMRLTSKANLTKRFPEKYKRMCPITRLYGIKFKLRVELHTYTCNIHTYRPVISVTHS